jgi:hypothetical protein
MARFRQTQLPVELLTDRRMGPGSWQRLINEEILEGFYAGNIKQNEQHVGCIRVNFFYAVAPY